MLGAVCESSVSVMGESLRWSDERLTSYSPRKAAVIPNLSKNPCPRTGGDGNHRLIALGTGTVRVSDMTAFMATHDEVRSRSKGRA